MAGVGTDARSAARGVFQTPLVMTKRLGNHSEKRMTEKRFRYLSGQLQLQILESPFFRFLGMSPKKPTKNYILVSPFDSKQMVRPHSWRSPEERTFRPHPPTIRFYEWWEVGYLGGIFCDVLTTNRFLAAKCRFECDETINHYLSA